MFSVNPLWNPWKCSPTSIMESPKVAMCPLVSDAISLLSSRLNIYSQGLPHSSIPGHQTIFFRSWYILLMLGCMMNSLLWASSNILFWRSPSLGTHILPWYRHISSLSRAKLVSFPDCTRCTICWKLTSWCCAYRIWSLKSLVILI